MDNLSQQYTERRNHQAEQHALWSHLNDAQKHAVSSLTGFGYMLSFMRICTLESIVVLQLNDKLATVDIDGEINTNPHLKIRQ